MLCRCRVLMLVLVVSSNSRFHGRVAGHWEQKKENLRVTILLGQSHAHRALLSDGRKGEPLPNCWCARAGLGERPRQYRFRSISTHSRKPRLESASVVEVELASVETATPNPVDKLKRHLEALSINRFISNPT